MADGTREDLVESIISATKRAQRNSGRPPEDAEAALRQRLGGYTPDMLKKLLENIGSAREQKEERVRSMRAEVRRAARRLKARGKNRKERRIEYEQARKRYEKLQPPDE